MRKKIGIDTSLMGALTILAQDLGRSPENLMDDAVRDLLRKHNRPLTLEDALRQSLRTLPLNDNGDARHKTSR